MNFKNKRIRIVDWAGKELLNDDYDSTEVDRVLNINKCKTCDSTGEIGNHVQGYTDCEICCGSGYEGDFEVYWEDENNTENVYEFINY